MGILDDIFGGPSLEQVLELIKQHYSRVGSEARRNELLASKLRECGLTVGANREGIDLVGSDFVIECKVRLTTQQQLYSIKGQLDSYMKLHAGKRLGVVIYREYNGKLLDELRRYCASRWPGSRVIALGHLEGPPAMTTKSLGDLELL